MNQYIALEEVLTKLDKSLKRPLNLVAYMTKAPKFMIITLLLSVLSIVAQQLVDISPKARMRFPVALYILILAASGERKSSCLKLLMKAIHDFERWLEEEMDKKLETYNSEHELWTMEKNSLKKKLDKAFSNGEDTTTLKDAWHVHHKCEPKRPLDMRILVDDISAAKMTSLLSGNNTSLAMVSDEALSVLSNTLLKEHSLFCSLWSGQSIRKDRANNISIHTEGARLTCCMQIQPNIYKTFRESNGDAMRNSGLDARFLFCQPDSAIGNRFESSEHETVNMGILNSFHARIDALLKEGMELKLQGKERYCLTLTSQAKELWLKKFNEIEYGMGKGQAFESYKDFGSKHLEQATRIAAVLHVFTNQSYKDTAVDYATMETAIMLMDIYFREAQIIFRSPEAVEIVDNSHADKLINWMFQMWKGEWFLKSAIRRRGPYGLRDNKLLDEAIETLIARGDILCFKKKQSIYIKLSAVRYPQYFSLQPITLNGLVVDGLQPYFGKYGLGLDLNYQAGGLRLGVGEGLSHSHGLGFISPLPTYDFSK